jgi:hypothetical protein
MRLNRKSNGSTEGDKHPYMKKMFWLKEYPERIARGNYFTPRTIERYENEFNRIMKDTKNISTIDPTLK